MAAGGLNDRCVVPPNGDSHNGAMKLRGKCCQKFSSLDAIFVVISLVTYLGDLITDCLLASQYFYNGQVVWGAWTLVFVLVPTITLQLFSLRWYISEKPVQCGSWNMVAHILLLGPVERYISVLKYGTRARKSNNGEDYKKLYHAQNDVAILRLLEAFMESAPQLLLQGYGILTTQDFTWITGLSSAFSLLSLSWAVASYSNALRLAYREAYMANWCGLLVQTCWQIGTVSSRVLAIVVFATAFQAWTFLTVGLHWLLMTVWVIIQGTDFCTRWWEEKLFDCVIGVVYIFSFLNLKDGPTRYRMGAFYVIMLVENSVLVGLWYHQRPLVDTLTIVVMAVVFGGFVFGLLCMLLYYRCCHPSGPIQPCRGTESEEPIQNNQDNGVNQRLVFDASVMSQSLPLSTTGYDLSLDSSWSGLIHSRRGDELTYTTSKYKGTSSRQLDFENCDLRDKGENCNQVFSTPLCAPSSQQSVPLCRHHSNTMNASGILHLTDTLASDQSYHLSDTCLVCSTILKSYSNSRDALIISKSEEDLTSQSESISLDLSNHRTRNPPQIVNGGYYNSAFSTTSLTSASTNCPQNIVAQRCRDLASLGSAPVLSTSLPMLCPPGGNALKLYQPCDTEAPRHSKGSNIPRQNSVFAITGMPRDAVARSVGDVNRDSKPLSPRSWRSDYRRFETAQSLLCIPTMYKSSQNDVHKRSNLEVSHISNLKLNALDCRSRESVSSLTSSVRPIPLSPLNAQSLWEESMDRFSKSSDFDEASQKLINSLNRSKPSSQSFEVADTAPCSKDVPSPSSVLSSPHPLPRSPILRDDPHLLPCADISVNKNSDCPRNVSEQRNLVEACFSFSESDGSRRESGGSQISKKEQSTDYFDYSDAGLVESHHTLSDLAGRLQMGLNGSTDEDAYFGNLRVSGGDSDAFADKRRGPLYSDTPWRVDYMGRAPTPVLSQSALSLYSASDHSLTQASDLWLSDGDGPLPLSSQLKHLGSKHIPMSLYAGSNGSLHSAHNFDSAQKPVINNFAENGKFRTPMKIYSLKKSPHRMGRNVDLFDSEAWRSCNTSVSSLSPEARKSCEHPLKLEQYGMSPYNFHRKSISKMTSGNERIGNGKRLNRQRPQERSANNSRNRSSSNKSTCRSDSGACSSTLHKLHIQKQETMRIYGTENRSRSSSSSTLDSGQHADSLSLESSTLPRCQTREQEANRSFSSGNKSNSSSNNNRNRSNHSSGGSRNMSNCSRNSSRNASSNSTSDSGQHSSGFDSSNSSVWNCISYSNTADDIQSHLTSSGGRQVLANSPHDHSSTTPNFSPIERTVLPPLRIGQESQQIRSYFSTPKVRWPTGEEFHLSHSHHTAEDSFFSLSLPRRRGERYNKDMSSMMNASSLEDVRLTQGSEAYPEFSSRAIGRGKENQKGRRKRESSKDSLSSQSTPSPRQPLHSINQRL